MILYYTATQKTKVFAQALAEVKGLTAVSQLKSKLGGEGKVSAGFIIKSLFYTLTNKPYPVDNMPALGDTREIYLCSPVWGGRVASPVLYFLQQADLKDRTVHVLLTCDSISQHDKYKELVLKQLGTVDCIAGNVHVFATNKESPPEKDVLIEQIRQMNV
jgi:hypothetical protein